jgi:leader peptidase (prepilin peptidase)/N-methyltransferase
MGRVLLGELPTWFIRAIAIGLGLIWGSFLNVVIYRVPRGMSVVRPASRCPSCEKPIEPYDNIPVLSFLILGGKTRCCKTKLSPRYPLVELLGGVLSWAIAEVLLRDPSLSAARAAAIFGADFALCMGLLAAAFIDLDHMYLPDVITIGGTILGIGTASFRDLSYKDALIGAVIGFVIVWLPFVFLYKRLRGRAGMGLGDAKLIMLAGAWFGWPGALFVLFAGAFQGSIGAVIVHLVAGKIEEPEAVRADREELQKLAAEGDEEAKKALEEDPLGTEPEEGLMKARLPFGPFLILACLEYLFFGEWIRARYLAFIAPS